MGVGYSHTKNYVLSGGELEDPAQFKHTSSQDVTYTDGFGTSFIFGDANWGADMNFKLDRPKKDLNVYEETSIGIGMINYTRNDKGESSLSIGFGGSLMGLILPFSWNNYTVHE